jgi:hypothetical protein
VKRGVVVTKFELANLFITLQVDNLTAEQINELKEVFNVFVSNYLPSSTTNNHKPFHFFPIKREKGKLGKQNPT